MKSSYQACPRNSPASIKRSKRVELNNGFLPLVRYNDYHNTYYRYEVNRMNLKQIESEALNLAGRGTGRTRSEIITQP